MLSSLLAHMITINNDSNINEIKLLSILSIMRIIILLLWISNYDSDFLIKFIIVIFKTHTLSSFFDLTQMLIEIKKYK